VSSQEFTDGIGKVHGWEEKKKHSRTVSLHRLAPRPAGQKEEEDEERQGAGERRGRHGRTGKEQRASGGASRGGAP
jgi:hypothetical protein